MSTDVQWTKRVDGATGGKFFSWGDVKGQFLRGRVLDYDPAGGTALDDSLVPQLELELTLPAKSFSKAAGWVDLAVGEVVTLTCSQANLRRVMRQANPEVGDLIQVKLDDIVERGSKTIKIFGIDLAHGTGGSGQAAAAPAAQQAPDFGQQAQAAAPTPPVSPVTQSAQQAPDFAAPGAAAGGDDPDFRF